MALLRFFSASLTPVEQLIYPFRHCRLKLTVGNWPCRYFIAVFVFTRTIQEGTRIPAAFQSAKHNLPTGHSAIKSGYLTTRLLSYFTVKIDSPYLGPTLTLNGRLHFIIVLKITARTLSVTITSVLVLCELHNPQCRGKSLIHK